MKLPKLKGKFVSSIFLGIIVGLLIPGAIILGKYKQSKVSVENTSKQSPQPEIKWEERTPISVPKGWKTYKINSDASISIPSEWYFFSHSQDPDTKEKNYTISNLKKLEYDDWNPGEEFRITLGTHKISNFEEMIQDQINSLYRQNLYKYPGEIYPYTLETFLISGNRAARFNIYEGKSTAPIKYRQLIKLYDDRILEINVGILKSQGQIQTVLDSLTLK